MPVLHFSLTYATHGKGTYEVTALVEERLRASRITCGMASVFCKHTSASLVIMENADPSARRDLEAFMEELVPESKPYFVHTYEGLDDMPSHIKMALTRTTELIPFKDGKLLLGTWQGIFLWEHRDQRHDRTLILSIIS